MFNNRSFEIAKKIRADKYIEDFLKEFYSHFENTGFIIYIITLLSFSALVFLLLFLVKPIYECIERRRQETFIRRIAYFNRNSNNTRGDNNNTPQLKTDVVQINSKSEENLNTNENFEKVEDNKETQKEKNDKEKQEKDANTLTIEDNQKKE